MNNTELAIKIRPRIKRMARAAELNEIAEKLGKHKTSKHEYQACCTYYWSENEIEKVIEML